MRIFLKKFFLFLLPILLIFSFSFFTFFKMGELTSLKRIVDLQLGGEVLVGKAFSDPNQSLKVLGTEKRQPEILILGTSRVMQFRSDFFLPNVSFYNAGGSIFKVTDFYAFLNTIITSGGEKPRLIIVGLDPHLFHYDGPMDKPTIPIKHDWYELLTNFLSHDGWQRFYTDFFNGKIPMSYIVGKNSPNYVGTNAIVNHNGFRGDGSYYYGKFLNDPSTKEEAQKLMKAKIQELVLQKRYGFEYEGSIETKSLDYLEEFLRLSRLHDIRLIGFLPPYASEIYKKIRSPYGGYKDSVNKFSVDLKKLFNDQGYSFYDFSSLSDVGSSNDELLDHIHGSEKVYLRLFIKMAEGDRYLATLTDLPYLKDKLLSSKSDFEVFGE